ERGDQRRRQVVDAEVAEVLERANRLRLAGTRKPRQDNEWLPAFRGRVPSRSPAIRQSRNAAPHRLPPGSSSSSSSSGGSSASPLDPPRDDPESTAGARSVCSSRSANARAA